MKARVRTEYNMTPSQNDPTTVKKLLASHRQKRSIKCPMGKERISARRSILNRKRKVPPE
jgi:hypothetical protein